MRRHCIGLLVVLALTLPVSAGLVGVTVAGCTNSVYSGAVTVDPGVCEPYAASFNKTAVIGPGVEFTVEGGMGTRTVNFTDTGVSIFYGRNQTSSSPDLYVFTGFPPGITGLTRVTPDPLAIQASFSNTAIAFLVSDPSCCIFENITVTYTIEYGAVPGDVTSVPEPASWWLLAGAATACACMRSRS